jgi:hypothetical protein
MTRGPVQTGEMLPLLKRHEIQVLLRAGHAQRDVATRTGTSLNTVRRVKLETTVTETDDAAERRARGVGRPSKTASFASKVLGWLSADGDLPTQELLRRARLEPLPTPIVRMHAAPNNRTTEQPANILPPLGVFRAVAHIRSNR